MTEAKKPSGTERIRRAELKFVAAHESAVIKQEEAITEARRCKEDSAKFKLKKIKEQLDLVESAEELVVDEDAPAVPPPAPNGAKKGRTSS